jgi:putative molybdopterin biosynthesis protein
VEPLHHIQDFEHLKVLSDARRLAILRLLMSAPATLSQLGQALGEHPAKVRHHLKLLERAGLIELVDQRVARGFVEKYYSARAGAYMLQQLVLPAAADSRTVTILGSHDLALEAMAHRLQDDPHTPSSLYVLPVGSLEGLMGLRQGLATVAGCHLLDPESGEYNLTYVRHFFPERSVSLVTLAHREQGLLTAPGNPKGIHDVVDLARPDVRLVNRNPGSGTRIWLDRSLRAHGIYPEDLRGYENEVRTHTLLAQAIQAGKADAGLGVRAAANQLGLGFTPLFEERFDLIVPTGQLEAATLRPLFDLLASGDFRRLIAALPGYRTDQTGSQINP